MADFITVEVAYALPERQSLLTVNVSPDSSVQQIIELSGILQQFSEIDLNSQKVGIWSRPVKLDDKAKEDGRADKVTGGRPHDVKASSE